MDVDFDDVIYRLCKLTDSVGAPIWVMVTTEVEAQGIIKTLIRGYKVAPDD